MEKKTCKHGEKKGRKVRFVGIQFLLLSTILLLQTSCLPPYYNPVFLISNYDPGQAYNGVTFFQADYWYPGYFAVDMDGEVLWSQYHSIPLQGDGLGFDLMSDGNVITMLESHPTIINPESGEILWDDPGHEGHHSVAETSWGTFLFIDFELVSSGYEPWGTCLLKSDIIKEVNLNGELVWEWHMIDHVDPVAHHHEGLCFAASGTGDWSHCNTIKFIENYSYRGHTYDAVLLLLSRQLDTFWMIDYASGDILWSCGQNGDFGERVSPLFNNAHEIDMIDHNDFILFDNSYERIGRIARALEFIADPETQTVQEVWSWTDPDAVMQTPWGGDANRLPNGNTLVVNVWMGSIIEVNPMGEKVWQMDMRHADRLDDPIANTIYKCERTLTLK